MSLKQQTISGVKWTCLERGSLQLLQLITIVILTKLLSPEEFGLVAITNVFIGFISVFNDFGIGSAIIQKSALSDNNLSSIFWFNLIIGFIATIFTILISPFIAAFYKKEVLFPLLSLLSIGFLLSSFSTVQQSLLMKNLSFKKIAIFEIVSSLTGSIIAITLAYRGYGVWSIAWQRLCSTLTLTSLFWITSQWRPALKFYFKNTRPIMGFSLNLLGSKLVNYFAANIDSLLIGKLLGFDSLGYYSLANRIMLYPLQNISNIISKVLFPVFSLLQNDNARFCNVYLKTTKYIAFITVPLMFVFFAITDELVLVVFGLQWKPIIFLLKVFCFVGMLKSIGNTTGQIYLAKGKTNWIFKWNIFAALATISAIFIGLFWNLEGVVIAIAIRTVLFIYPNFAIPFRLINLKLKSLLLNLMTVFMLGSIMCIIVTGSVLLQRYLLIGLEFRLLSNILLGIITYIFIAKILCPNDLKEFQKILLGENITKKNYDYTNL